MSAPAKRVCECDCFECSIKRHDICRYLIKCIQRPYSSKADAWSEVQQ